MTSNRVFALKEVWAEALVGAQLQPLLNAMWRVALRPIRNQEAVQFMSYLRAIWLWIGL
jgi:hypothetical protein